MNLLTSFLNKAKWYLKMAAAMLVVLCGCQSLSATNYYSISDGGWQDNHVWSFDGVNQCGCNPGSGLVGDSVFVKHHVGYWVNMQIKSSSYLRIDSLASLTGTNHRIDVQSGDLIVKGELHSKEIMVDPGSNFEADGFVTISGASFTNSGVSSVNGKLSVTGANENLSNSLGAQLTIGMSGNITVVSGDVINAGLLIFAPVSCASINGGGDFNNSGGSSAVVGIGAVWSGGTLYNEGYWDPNVSWCADSCAGSGAGSLPTKDCNTSCGPLPVILSSFAANLKNENEVNLEWEVTLEKNNDFFTIERSVDGQTFEFVKNVSASEMHDYSTVDFYSVEGTVLYRLSQTDMNGRSSKLATQAVQNEAGIKIEAYPNPIRGSLNVSLCGFSEGLIDIRILDLSGQTVMKSNMPSTGGKGDLMIDCQKLRPGIYFLSASNGTTSRKIRFVKL